MDKLKKQFEEACDKIPFNTMGINGKDGQTLYGDVIDWCRDYFNEPKNSMLAYMLVGEYYTRKEMEYYKRKTK